MIVITEDDTGEDIHFDYNINNGARIDGPNVIYRDISSQNVMKLWGDQYHFFNPSGVIIAIDKHYDRTIEYEWFGLGDRTEEWMVANDVDIRDISEEELIRFKIECS